MIVQSILSIIIVVFLLIIGILTIVTIKLNKKEKEMKNSLNELISKTPTMSLGDRLDSNDKLFTFIDAMIDLEIINTRRFEIFLNKKNNNLDIDNVIKEVSTNVFNSINSNVFVDKNNIVTSSYIMTYIQKKTLLLYLQYIQENVANQL